MFHGGKISPDVEAMRRAVKEMVDRQVKARNDMLEKVLLESLAGGTCGVLVWSDANGEQAKVDHRVPYATIVYARSEMAGHALRGLEPATTPQLHALLQHLAKKVLDR